MVRWHVFSARVREVATVSPSRNTLRATQSVVAVHVLPLLASFPVTLSSALSLLQRLRDFPDCHNIHRRKQRYACPHCALPSRILSLMQVLLLSAQWRFLPERRRQLST